MLIFAFFNGCFTNLHSIHFLTAYSKAGIQYGCIISSIGKNLDTQPTKEMLLWQGSEFIVFSFL
jgi:hypothetical protein